MRQFNVEFVKEGVGYEASHPVQLTGLIPGQKINFTVEECKDLAQLFTLTFTEAVKDRKGANYRSYNGAIDQIKNSGIILRGDVMRLAEQIDMVFREGGLEPAQAFTLQNRLLDLWPDS
jgi:hypothetical protein